MLEMEALEGRVHKPAEQLPIAVSAGEARIRSAVFGEMAANLVQVPKGTDFSVLLEGLPGNICQCPHWGYLLEGAIHIRYSDGDEETVNAGEVFYWPSGHTGWVEQDTVFLEFSPAHSMSELLAHFKKKVAA